MILNVSDDVISVKCFVAQNITAFDIHFAQYINSVCGIVVVSGRKQKLNRIA